MGSYAILLSIASIISISFYEGLVVGGIVYFLAKRGFSFQGDLRIPVTGFILSTVIPTLLFFPKMFFKSLNEGLFQIIYFLKTENSEKTLSKLPFVFVFIGIVGLPVVLYNVAFREKVKLFWGGPFEVASFYTIFAFSSFILSFYFYCKEKRISNNVILYTILGIVYLSIVIYSARRSYLIGIPIVFILLSWVLMRNKILAIKHFLLGIILIMLGSVIAYSYLSTKDIRFQILNRILIGEENINPNTLNAISSARYNILLDGLEIIETDIKERRFLNLLIGHGIRSGLYLPHKRSPQDWQRYESIIFVSELIERGLIGLLSIIAIYFIAFKRFIEVKLEYPEDILLLFGFIPLLIHLIGAIFTFFWDALLPLFLLLFKLSEIAYQDKK